MTTMSIKTFLHVGAKLPATVSVLLRGNHGIGKSQVVRQLAEALKASDERLGDFPVIDRRLSQLTEGDIIGLPVIDGDSTRFNPPDWYKRACESPCLVFLDELNRATPEVMQGSFQIVLDRELNGHRLHPLTRVMSAINTGAAYNVNEVDPALLDRFFVLDLTPSPEEWADWARGKLHDTIVDFIAQDNTWLDPSSKQDPGTVQQSRRSWDRLSDALVSAGIADEPQHELFYPICNGFVGTEATIAFRDYAVDNARVQPEDVIDRYDVNAKRVRKLSQTKLNALIDRVARHMLDNDMVLTGVQGKNVGDFVKDLPAELVIHAWKAVAAGSVAKVETIKSFHSVTKQYVIEALGASDATKAVTGEEKDEEDEETPAPAKATKKAKKTK
jgi:hypothetical protein